MRVHGERSIDELIEYAPGSNRLRVQDTLSTVTDPLEDRPARDLVYNDAGRLYQLFEVSRPTARQSLVVVVDVKFSKFYCSLPGFFYCCVLFIPVFSIFLLCQSLFRRKRRVEDALPCGRSFDHRPGAYSCDVPPRFTHGGR